MAVDHEFGDQHTELKLSIVEKYLKFFTKALRGKFEELQSGHCTGPEGPQGLPSLAAPKRA